MHASRLFVLLTAVAAAHAVDQAGQTPPPPPPPQPSLEEQVKALDQKVRILERKAEIAKEAGASAQAKAGSGGFFVASGDSAFSLHLGLQLQLDGRFFLNDEIDAATNNTGQTNTFTERRVRPFIEGTVARDVAYRVVPDFAGGAFALQDAWVDGRWYKPAQVQIGKFKSPVGLERLQSTASLTFVELGLTTNIVPNYDVGVSVHGDVFDESLNYAIAALDGAGDGASRDTDVNDDKDIAGRVFLTPFKRSDSAILAGLGFGVGSSLGIDDGTVAAPGLSQYRTSGQETFFRYVAGTPATATNTAIASGRRYRIVPQLYDYVGPFGLLAEYARSTQAVQLDVGNEEDITNDAWQLAISWVLTGEHASYKGVVPAANFDPASGTWGAFEVAARYTELTVDDDAFDLGYADPLRSARQARAWAAGLNWYLNKNLKAQLNYEQTAFDGGARTVSGDEADRETENLIVSRVQIAF